MQSNNTPLAGVDLVEYSGVGLVEYFGLGLVESAGVGLVVRPDGMLLECSTAE